MASKTPTKASASASGLLRLFLSPAAIARARAHIQTRRRAVRLPESSDHDKETMPAGWNGGAA